MGGEGLKESSEISVLNSNYVAKKLKDEKGYSLPYAPEKPRKHEAVISASPMLEDVGVSALYVSKKLLDFGLHAPTTYFPLIVPEALMIEPTESESKKDLDNYIDVLVKITDEEAEIVKDAPKNTPVKRIDEVGATKDPVLTWNF